MKLVFATNNQHKLNEVKKILGNKFEIIWLKEFWFDEDIPETQNTFKWNASQKSHFFYDKFKTNCFAEDSWLEVKSLWWEPWVYSARYSWWHWNSAENRKKVLEKMIWKDDRSANFTTAISLIIDWKEYFFEGIVNWKITEKEKWESDFGYDQIFIPDWYEKTFAEMTSETKNKISHRGEAIKKFVEFLII